ncbi:LOW QUALITY PROTEIN: hypothetical protein CVT25_013501 [Psilocybe cyanescens]|uniref:Protein-S-isoprenylcysteine O-methyltransferase n=1 Tax=Psilocybe cyanescens TaxID=93625 RepID=A0A409XSJ5_PSICY|nr:LOW QUALITY PROTEIN: hypothetical protein CVT25_013501 [Psilocybe cyanescens]
MAATIGFHKAATPPHPPPSAEESAPSTFLEIVLKPKIVPHMVTIICWYIALAEIVVILALEIPGIPLSGHILSLFVYNDKEKPLNIRPTYTFFLGTCMAIAGSSIRLACFRALGRLFTFEMSIRKNHRLVIDGPYSVVRHPASPFDGVWDTALAEQHMVVALLLRMSKEDEQLKKNFGREWNEWKNSVPYKLIPFVY